MEKYNWYDANFDEELIKERENTRQLYIQINNCLDDNLRNQLFDKLLPDKDTTSSISTPFYCDYGKNIKIGKNSFINLNNYFMDGAPITIGDNCFIGPNCGFYTAIHPLHHHDRNLGVEKALPITIGNNVWLGGDVTILPGVTIGNNVVIGAKSLVTKDIPNNVLAYGQPCQVIREITDEDLIKR